MNEMHDSRPLEDPSEIQQSQRRRRNRSLQWVLLGIVLLMVGMALVDHLLAPSGESRSFISLSMGGVALLFWLVLRARPRRGEGPLLVFSLLVFGAWAVFSYGSVRAASALAFLGAVVMAGTYLRLRWLVATALAAVLLLGALTWAETQGLMPKPGMAADLRFWLMGSAIIVVIGAQLLYMRRATDEAHVRRLNHMEDRMRLERERDQSLRRFRRIFDLNPTALMIQVANTQAVLEVNPAFVRLMGYASERLQGQSAGVLWADAQLWQAHRESLFAQGRTGWQRALWLRPDGRTFDATVCSELSEDQSGMLILTTVLDWSGDDADPG